MTFNFDMAASITIDADSIKQILKDAVEARTGRTVESVEFKTTMGYAEHNEIPSQILMIDGAVINLKKPQFS